MFVKVGLTDKRRFQPLKFLLSYLEMVSLLNMISGGENDFF